MTKGTHLSDLLCHCPTTPEGHPLTTPGCESAGMVKAGNYPSRSRSAPSHQRPSSMAADIYTALSKAATTPAERNRWREIAAISSAADSEWSAQERLASSLDREHSALQKLRTGTPAEKRAAEVSLRKAREQLERAKTAARSLRLRNLPSTPGKAA